jgi:hypothetical protein
MALMKEPLREQRVPKKANVSHMVMGRTASHSGMPPPPPPLLLLLSFSQVRQRRTCAVVRHIKKGMAAKTDRTNICTKGNISVVVVLVRLVFLLGVMTRPMFRLSCCWEMGSTVRKEQMPTMVRTTRTHPTRSAIQKGVKMAQ